jgi:preprotein translocase subunit SecG
MSASFLDLQPFISHKEFVVALALSILLVITSILMILLVLLHKGKGSGLSDLFGGGMSSTYGGSSVVEKNLDRITIVVGGIWFAAVIALGLVLK